MVKQQNHYSTSHSHLSSHDPYLLLIGEVDFVHIYCWLHWLMTPASFFVIFLRKLSYCRPSDSGSHARELKMSTDPSPQKVQLKYELFETDHLVLSNIKQIDYYILPVFNHVQHATCQLNTIYLTESAWIWKTRQGAPGGYFQPSRL